MAMRGRRLYRSRTDRMLSGVSGGLADYFEVDPALVRLMWILSGIFSGGLVVLVYLAMWIVVPEEPIALARPRAAAMGGAIMSTTTSTGTTSSGDPETTVERETTIEGEPVERTAIEYESVGTYPEPDHGSRRAWAGIILISLGLIFLGNNFGLFRWVNWGLFWPLVLVGVGVWLLVQRRR